MTASTTACPRKCQPKVLSEAGALPIKASLVQYLCQDMTEASVTTSTHAGSRARLFKRTYTT